MKVELINYTRDGERLIAQAGKLCYSPVGVDEIMEELDDESVEPKVYPEHLLINWLDIDLRATLNSHRDMLN